MYFRNAAAERRVFLHLRHIVQQEQKLTVACAREHGKLLTIFEVSIEPCIEDFILPPILSASVFQLLPYGGWRA